MTHGSIGFFDGLAADIWSLAKSEEETAAEADYLLSRLGIEAPGRLLDVPCGDGRLARAVAAHGHQVTGIDASQAMIQRAGAAAHPRCDWRLGDMMNVRAALADLDTFNGIYCFGNSIGYLDRKATAGFLADLGALLKPQARFVIETEMTAESVLPNFGDRLWQQVDDILMVVEHSYDASASRLESDYRFFRGAVMERRRLDHTIFTTGEIVAMLDAAGFDVLALEGDLDGTPFSLGDTRLLLTAVRR